MYNMTQILASKDSTVADASHEKKVEDNSFIRLLIFDSIRVFQFCKALIGAHKLVLMTLDLS